jgi:hypothetical protein
MIVELENDKRHQSLFRDRKADPNQRIVLPEPATNVRSYQVLSESGRNRRLTLSIKPEQRLMRSC